MKNILVYINPAKTFFGRETGKSRDNTTLVKIQIDNSLSLGWKKEDILLFTNFEYEYNGVQAIILEDDLHCSFRPLSTKNLTIAYLLENNLLEEDDLLWVHDFDAFQLNPFDVTDVDLGSSDMGISDYGYSPKWSMGSIFFKKSAKDIFSAIKATVFELETEDERALSHITSHKVDNIQTRIKRLNITFNFGMRNIGFNYNIATKPVKVLHFHPNYNLRDNYIPATPLEMFMYGKNDINTPLMDERLIKIFNQHGIS